MFIPKIHIIKYRSSDEAHEVLPLVGALHLLLKLTELGGLLDQILMIPRLEAYFPSLKLFGQFFTHLAHTNEVLKLRSVLGSVLVVLVLVVSLQSDRDEFKRSFLDAQIQIFMLFLSEL